MVPSDGDIKKFVKAAVYNEVTVVNDMLEKYDIVDKFSAVS
jgi:hypothetical protein